MRKLIRILCVNFNFTDSNDTTKYVTHTIKKTLFATRAKSLRPRCRPTLGPAAPPSCVSITRCVKVNFTPE